MLSSFRKENWLTLTGLQQLQDKKLPPGRANEILIGALRIFSPGFLYLIQCQKRNIQIKGKVFGVAWLKEPFNNGTTLFGKHDDHRGFNGIKLLFEDLH